MEQCDDLISKASNSEQLDWRANNSYLMNGVSARASIYATS